MIKESIIAFCRWWSWMASENYKAGGNLLTYAHLLDDFSIFKGLRWDKMENKHTARK